MDGQQGEFARTQRELKNLILAIEANGIRMRRSGENAKKLNAAIETSKSAGTTAKSIIKVRSDG